MRVTRLLPAFAATLMFGASLGHAQTATYTELEDEDVTIAPFNITADDLEEMSVYDAAGDEIGEVDEVLVDSAGQPALAVEVGGFLGVGERKVVLTLDQVQAQNDRLVTAMTEDQLKALPAWDD